MIEFNDARRRLVTLAGAGLALAGSGAQIVRAAPKKQEPVAEENEEKPVGAVEDLMREHGVIRRAILVYRFAAGKLRANAQSVDPKLLRRTAQLFRYFGEDYHERKLEEAYIFPRLKKAGGPGAAYVDVLVAQHQRGREITDYVLSLTGKGVIGTGDAEPLARALDGTELMYAHHAAREDTIVFPAWKEALSAHELDEMGEKFEDIEHQEFGKDGFGDAVAQIASVEQALGVADIAQFTPPPPPKA